MNRGSSFARRPAVFPTLRAVGPASLALTVLASASWALAAEPQRYRVDPEHSWIDVKVGTAGLFKFAGHDHGVRVKIAKGEIVGDPVTLSASSVSLDFSMADVRVVTSEGSQSDIPKVQEKMAGPAVLDAARFPEARFRSRRVSGKILGPGRFELDVAGDLTLHGATQPVSSRLVVEVQGGRLVARGPATLKQTDFGIEPVSVAGVVKVKNELSLEIEIVALAGPPE
jgi:polyisoprenoid-binding protein YceI